MWMPGLNQRPPRCLKSLKRTVDPGGCYPAATPRLARFGARGEVVKTIRSVGNAPAGISSTGGPVPSAMAETSEEATMTGEATPGVTISVNTETNADKWWGYVRDAVDGQLPATLRHLAAVPPEIWQLLTGSGRVVVTPARADDLLAWCRRLPGWNDTPNPERTALRFR